jgi:hypothetical protein
MDWNEMCLKAIEYFEDHDDELREVLEAADIYDYGDTHPMDDLEELYSGEDPLDIMKLALRSTDERYSDFDLDRDYFRVESDGSLTSTDDRSDPLDYLDGSMIQDIYDNRDYVDLPRYIEKLFAVVGDDNEEEEDEEDEV